MAVLGRPYRIMYLSRGGRTGLTDVNAVVLRPDKSINGIFPLTELPGVFRGCYVYDYLTSVEDAEGKYFSRIVSPTESYSDISSFELQRPAGADTSLAARPVNIAGYLVSGKLEGYLLESDELWADVSQGYVSGYLKTVVKLQGQLGDLCLRGVLRAHDQI